MVIVLYQHIWECGSVGPTLPCDDADLIDSGGTLSPTHITVASIHEQLYEAGEAQDHSQGT